MVVPRAQDSELDPLRRAVLARLADDDYDAHDHENGWRLSRAAWRAGELRLREAEPFLVKSIGSGDAMLDYSIAAALSRLGSPASIPALREIEANTQHPDQCSPHGG